MLESMTFKKLLPKNQEDFSSLFMNRELKLYTISYQITPFTSLATEKDWLAKPYVIINPSKSQSEITPEIELVSRNVVPRWFPISSVQGITRFSLRDVISETTPQISKEVLEFSQKYGLQEYLSQVIHLVHSCIPNIQRLETRLEQDPEVEGEEWISIEIDVKSDVEVFLSSYDHYIRQLVTQIPWPERSRFRLSYNIL